MPGKLSIAGAVAATLMIPTALSAQVGGAVNPGAGTDAHRGPEHHSMAGCHHGRVRACCRAASAAASELAFRTSMASRHCT